MIEPLALFMLKINALVAQPLGRGPRGDGDSGEIVSKQANVCAMVNGFGTPRV